MEAVDFAVTRGELTEAEETGVPTLENGVSLDETEYSWPTGTVAYASVHRGRYGAGPHKPTTVPAKTPRKSAPKDLAHFMVLSLVAVMVGGAILLAVGPKITWESRRRPLEVPPQPPMPPDSRSIQYKRLYAAFSTARQKMWETREQCPTVVQEAVQRAYGAGFDPVEPLDSLFGNFNNSQTTHQLQLGTVLFNMATIRMNSVLELHKIAEENDRIIPRSVAVYNLLDTFNGLILDPISVSNVPAADIIPVLHADITAAEKCLGLMRALLFDMAYNNVDTIEFVGHIVTFNDLSLVTEVSSNYYRECRSINDVFEALIFDGDTGVHTTGRAVTTSLLNLQKARDGRKKAMFEIYETRIISPYLDWVVSLM